MAQTSVYGDLFLKVKTSGGNTDPFDTKFYKSFTGIVSRLIDARWTTIGVVVGLFILSLLAFGGIKQSFFPAIDKPYFKVDFWELMLFKLKNI
jgi:multidrug efflux pump subunit AcrB